MTKPCVENEACIGSPYVCYLNTPDTRSGLFEPSINYLSCDVHKCSASEKTKLSSPLKTYVSNVMDKYLFFLRLIIYSEVVLLLRNYFSKFVSHFSPLYRRNSVPISDCRYQKFLVTICGKNTCEANKYVTNSDYLY